MAKIKLSNGDILNVDSGCIAVIMDDLTAIETHVSAYTKENLSKVEVLGEDDEVTLVLKDKYLVGFDGTQVEDGPEFIVCFRIADVYTIEEKIAKLEEENAKLNEAMKELLGV